MSDETECGICLSTYDRGEHLPRVLPCAHTLCTSCLQRLKTHRATIQCPFDRTKYRLPNDDITDFPVNSAITQTLQSDEDRSTTRIPEPIVMLSRRRRHNTITVDDLLDERNVSEDTVWEYNDRTEDLRHNSSQHDTQIPILPRITQRRHSRQHTYARRRRSDTTISFPRIVERRLDQAAQITRNVIGQIKDAFSTASLRMV